MKHFLFKTKGGTIVIIILTAIVLCCGGNALVAPPKVPKPNPSSSVQVPVKPKVSKS